MIFWMCLGFSVRVEVFGSGLWHLGVNVLSFLLCIYFVVLVYGVLAHLSRRLRGELIG